MFVKIIALAQSIGGRIASFTTSPTISPKVSDVKRITYQIVPYKFHSIVSQTMRSFFEGCQKKGLMHTRSIHHHHNQTYFYISIPETQVSDMLDLFYRLFDQTECVRVHIAIPTTRSRRQVGGYDAKVHNPAQGVGIVQLINTINKIKEDTRVMIDIDPKTYTLPVQKTKVGFRDRMMSVKSDTSTASYDMKIRYSCHTTDTTNTIVSSLTSILQSQTSHSLTVSPTPKRSGIDRDLLSQVITIPSGEECQTLSTVSYRKLPYPAQLPTLETTIDHNQITLLGSTEYRDHHIKFGIPAEDKLKHIYIVGKTGTGKSTLISQMVKSDMVTNKGLCLIDPHGDLIQTVLCHVPSYRINDIILFDVADQEYPIGFNLLEATTEQEQNLTVSGLVTTFKKLYGNSRGPRLEYILRLSLLTIIKYPNSSLLHLTKILTDANFRTQVLKHITDPLLLNFRNDEFNKRPDRLRDESISPILNKVGQFLSSPIVRNMFGQHRSAINLRDIMDQGKILLVNLSKGQIGEDNCDMIGSFLVSKFQIDALSRADSNFADRRDFYLYIDEFQNFATDSFATIFSEARKYKLSLIVANQYIGQLVSTLKEAIFGNVGTIISFALGFEDAIAIKSQFKDLVSEHDIQNLPKFHAYIRMMIDGVMSDPFSMSTFPLTTPDHANDTLDKIRQQSRERYATSKTVIQKELEQISTTRTKNPPTKTQLAFIKNRGGNNSIGDHTHDRTHPSPPISHTTSADQSPPRIITDLSNTQIQNIDDLVPSTVYTGIIKLKYNYGLFVIVGKVEGLLHKSQIIVENPELSWKKLFTPGDQISVMIHEIVDTQGVKKVLWTHSK